jgi:hypothetical protein
MAITAGRRDPTLKFVVRSGCRYLMIRVVGAGLIRLNQA